MARETGLNPMILTMDGPPINKSDCKVPETNRLKHLTVGEK